MFLHDNILEQFLKNPEDFLAHPEYHTKENWLAIVKMSGNMLRHCPVDYLSEEIVMECVKRQPWCVAVAPLLTEEICVYAAKRGYWQDVPEEFWTKAVQVATVYARPDAIADIDRENIDYNMALMVVRNDGLDIDYVPYELRTVEICVEAVKECSLAMSFVPHTIRQEVLEKAREFYLGN